jgi:hypothetical protein
LCAELVESLPYWSKLKPSAELHIAGRISLSRDLSETRGGCQIHRGRYETDVVERGELVKWLVEQALND